MEASSGVENNFMHLQCLQHVRESRECTGWRQVAGRKTASCLRKCVQHVRKIQSTWLGRVHWTGANSGAEDNFTPSQMCAACARVSERMAHVSALDGGK
jgi:hypothetical protein